MATTEQKWAAGEPKRFAIDVSGAGPGALSVVPMRERDIECSVEKGDAPGTYYVILKPLATGPHLVYILYGGREIPNGIISFEVRLFGVLCEQ
ncbi:unnamed protein product [Anisakis simplex]|uniref:Filamin-A n=1 Tax=Anisakis simplex TaxID=6269 RepID=A0A0M3JLQ6_ANISI|nr:unnamed protein product [Anisakis simplex]